MGKTIGLKQLAQKKYNVANGLPPEWEHSIGTIEDTFDAILYGPSGSGKTNCMVMLLKALLKAFPKAKAEYISYEEGHGFTIQTLMIGRHNMLETVGNRLHITEHLSYTELCKRLAKRQSAKIWVFDSIQASSILWLEYKGLKETYVGSKKKKIFLCIAWGEGNKPDGAVAKKIEYYCQIKMRVEGKIMFPKSRFGGNQPFVIWEGSRTEGAMQYWGKNYYRISGREKPKSTNKKPKPQPNENFISTAGDSTQPDVSEQAGEINCEQSKLQVA
jgi:hypothetical protein